MEEAAFSRILLNKDGKFPVVVQATLDVFRTAVAIEEYYMQLLRALKNETVLLYLAGQCLSAGGKNEALWCLMLIQLDPPAEVAALIEIVRGAFATSVAMPTGLRLRDSTYGSSHIFRDKVVECRQMSKVATRILLVAVGRWLQDNNRVYDPRDEPRRSVFMQLCRQQLVLEDDDTMTIIHAAKAISHGIPVDIFAPGPSELLVQNLTFAKCFIGPFFRQLTQTLRRFFQDKLGSRQRLDELKACEEQMRDADFAFQGVLFEVAAVDLETDLPVPLAYYLKDSEALKEAYALKIKTSEALVAGTSALKAANESVQLLTQCCRLLLVLCSVMVHTLVVERGRLPTRHNDDAEEKAACSFLCALDWRDVVAFGSFERRVSHCLLSRLFMACAARSFPSLQDIFTSDGVLSAQDSDEEDAIVPCPARVALTDLSSPHLSWFPSRERNDTEDEALPLEEVLLRRQIRLPTLDTRITTAFCYWAILFNPQAQRKLLSWQGPTSVPLWRELVLKSRHPTAVDLPKKKPEKNEEATAAAAAEEEEEDRSAPLVAFLRAAPTPSDPDSCQIVQDVGACSYFAAFHATAMADAFLTFSTLEGASCLLLNRRGLHPLDVVSAVVSQASSETLRSASLDDHQAELCFALVEVVRADQAQPPLERSELTLHSALGLYSHLHLVRPSFLCPSSGVCVQSERDDPDATSAAYLATLTSQSIYSGLVTNVLPSSLGQHCPFGTSLKVLTALIMSGHIDLVVSALQTASAESRINWSLAEQFGKDDDDDNPFIMPMMLAVEGGAMMLLHYYVEKRRIKGVLENEALVASITAASGLVKHNAMVLLCCAAHQSSVLCDVLLRKANYLSSVLLHNLALFSPTARSSWPSLVEAQYPGSMIESFRPLDFANQALLLARTLTASGRRFRSASEPCDQFLFAFCLVGDGCPTGLQVAASMFVFASRGLAAELTADFREGEGKGEESNPPPSQWEAFVLASCRERLQDVVLFTLELFCEVATRRPEVQTHLSLFCSDVFPCLPSHLKAPPEGGRFAHLGAAESAARFIAGACWRHEGCQTLVLQSGCVDGLMSALAACTDEALTTRRELSRCIVEAIELLVVRNESAWKFVQECSGIRGLLQLIRLGGTKIKNLACSTLQGASSDDTQGVGYANAVTAAGGLSAIAPLLNSEVEEETTCIGALRLINALCIFSPFFRLEAYSPTLSVPLLRLLCRSRSSNVRALVCAVLSTLAADKPTLLRRILQGTRAAMDVLMAMAAAKGDPYLSQSATTALACLTESDDSEYPTGSPYLRSVLHSAGYLPALKH